MEEEAEEMVAGCNVRKTQPYIAGLEEGGMGPPAKEVPMEAGEEKEHILLWSLQKGTQPC